MEKLNKSFLITTLVVLFVFGSGVALAAGPLPINLLSAGNFVILSKTGTTDTGSHSCHITGNIGSSPITAAAMNDVFCSEITGTIYGTNAAYVGSGSQVCFAGNPPLSNKTLVDNAVLDMEAAYTAAAGVTNPTATGLGAGNIGGMTLAPGLYKWNTDVNIPTSVTLSGGVNDVWIFQIAGNLNIASGGSVPAGIKVILSGGAKASNVFWQVGGVTGATLGTYSTFNGTILAAKQVIIQTGAVLNGRALSQTQVTLDANVVTTPVIITPLESTGAHEGTINVVKIVINDNGGTKTVADFPLFVNDQLVVSGVTNTFFAPAAVYVVSETSNSNYTKTFSGDCDINGGVNLVPGDNKFCIITNNDMGTVIVPTVPPLIDVVKVPSPLSLPSGPGSVTYTYTLRNIGTIPVTNITMVGDSCSPIILNSGDVNNDSKLDTNETWVYRCTLTLSETHTNTVVATGWANGISATDIASATVVVGVPTIPPLIHVSKTPSPLTLISGGGLVTYIERVNNPGTVALSNITFTNDSCSPMRYVSGDTNNDSKLDPNETWIYACQANITKTTTSTSIASGQANGLTVRDLAVATVVVSAPGLPNTGLHTNNTSWIIFILAGILALTSFAVVLKKRKI